MRVLAYSILTLALLAGHAAADEIVLRADPHPIVSATINDRPARLLVDPTLPDVIVLDPGASTRLGVRPAPMIGARVVLDDTSVKARVARPSVRFANGRSSRAFAGLFSARWAAIDGVDGALGPGVLPYDTVRIVLRDGAGGATRSFPLPKAEVWQVRETLAGEPVNLAFNLRRPESLLNRAAAVHLDEQDLFTPTGEPRPTNFFLGLSTTTQPGQSPARVGGFALGATLARTPTPLTGPDDVDVVVVRADPDRVRRYVELGRAALSACYELSWSRRTRALSLRCEHG